MSENTASPFEQAAAFQKTWMESMAKMAQAAFSAPPESAPPEILRQMRNGIFEALAKSWEEFMRSPQFLEAVKQMMDNAIAFKQLTSEMLTKAHHDMQGTARTDIDTILLSVRQLESRVFERIDQLGVQLDQLQRQFEQVVKDRSPGSAAPKVRRRQTQSTRKPPRRS